MGMGLRISRCLIDTIHQNAVVAAPNEACGLLFGDADRITDFRHTLNVAEFPERGFEIDPAALFAALRAQRSGGPKLLGYWHSHPNGCSEPSETDAAMAEPDGSIWLIVTKQEVVAWRAIEGGFEPVDLVVEYVERLEIDGEQIRSVRDFHRALKDSGAVPSFYGENYDALWDALTGLIVPPFTVIWRNAAISRKRLPGEFDKLVHIMRHAESQMSDMPDGFKLELIE